VILTKGEFDELLSESIDEALSSLGKFSKDALYQYIEKEYKVPKKDIPRRIDELSAGLHRVFGSSGRAR